MTNFFKDINLSRRQKRIHLQITTEMEEQAVTVGSDSKTTNAPTTEDKKEEMINIEPERASSDKRSEQQRSKSTSSRHKRSKSRSTSAHVVSDSSCSRSRSPSRHSRRRSASSGHRGRRRIASPTRTSRSRSVSPEQTRYASRARSASRRRQQAPTDQVHEDCTKIHVVLQDVQETSYMTICI